MSATITTTKATYKGRTIQSILRNRFGKTADLYGSQILRSDRYGTHVKAVVTHVEGDREQHSNLCLQDLGKENRFGVVATCIGCN